MKKKLALDRLRVRQNVFLALIINFNTNSFIVGSAAVVLMGSDTCNSSCLRSCMVVNAAVKNYYSNVDSQRVSPKVSRPILCSLFLYMR